MDAREMIFGPGNPQDAVACQAHPQELVESFRQAMLDPTVRLSSEKPDGSLTSWGTETQKHIALALSESARLRTALERIRNVLHAHNRPDTPLPNVKRIACRDIADLALEK